MSIVERGPSGAAADLAGLDRRGSRFSVDSQRRAVVAVLLLWCGALVLYRMHLAPDRLPIWLQWNLVLAAVPMVFSFGFRAARTRNRLVPAGLCFALWLLFLPNAYYIITDIIHLARRPDVPLWYDLALLVSCAGTGVMFGYFSQIEVQNVVDKRFGKAAGWAITVGALFLSAFGIYLGRFLRWNSWNALTDPLALARAVAEAFVHPGTHPNPVPVTLIFGGALTLGYAAVRSFGAAMGKDTQRSL